MCTTPYKGTGVKVSSSTTGSSGRIYATRRGGPSRWCIGATVYPGIESQSGDGECRTGFALLHLALNGEGPVVVHAFLRLVSMVGEAGIVISIRDIMPVFYSHAVM